MAQIFLAAGGIFGALSVAGGAFGAHALKGKLTEGALASFETGVRYQMYHAIALIFIALLLSQFPSARGLVGAGICFILGVFLFSGSLYGLTLGGIKALGPVTPLGGLSFIIGWGLLAFSSRSLVG